MSLAKQTLNKKAKQAVIGQLADRGLRAIIKGTDIVIEDKIKAKVHAKQGRVWPALKGPVGRDILVLVDYENVFDSPEFYVLSLEDWKETAEKDLNERIRDGRHFKGDATLLPPHYIPQHSTARLSGTGALYKGTEIKCQQVFRHKNCWDKIEKLLRK